jgi:Rrf2 family protein
VSGSEAGVALLNRKADYALLILSYLHRHTEGGNARAIAEEYGLSRPFVANILKELGHRGYVTSTRGVKGGYGLHEGATRKTLAELLSAIDEEFQLTVCSNHPATATCEVESVCTVKVPMHAIHQRIMEVLRGVTLAEVLSACPPTPLLQPNLRILDRKPHPDAVLTPA